MAFSPHHFGRYTIVDPIAVGGMAEIYRARITDNSQGADRIIVIKKVIANLQKNAEFLEMFEEEIKITVGLTHPNIIQIYDYGKIDDQYFMAMEYVEGKNLRQFVKRLADMKSMFSLDMSCHILVQTCQALGFAHNFKDRLTGKSLGIVHRDISPQNIMISYEGAVKLFDFGIAKAKTANESTQAGVIKGKPSYLSPEQINGEELDGRSDIFALGICLWELLTAKRLFVSDTDMGVLRMIQNAKIEPPSTFNPAVPQQLDAIVLKALSRDKTKRYQTAEEFQRDLNKFLYSFNPNFNPADLSYYAQELFKNEIKEDRERLMKYLAMPVTGSNSEAEDKAGGEKKKKAPASTKLADGLVSSTDFNLQMMESNVKNAKTDLGPGIEIEGTTGVKKGAGVGIKVDRSKLGAPPGSRSGADMVIPPWTKQGGGSRPGTRAGTDLQGAVEQGKKGSLVWVVGALAAVLAVCYYTGALENTPLDFIYGGKTKVAETTKRQPEPPVGVTPTPPPNPNPANIPTTRTPANLNMGTVILSPNVENPQVYIKAGSEPEKQVPAVSMPGNKYSIQVPLNVEVAVTVSKIAYSPASLKTVVNDARPVAFTVDLKKLAIGTLTLTTTPPGSKLTFFGGDGSQFSLDAPITRKELPSGRYKVVIENFGFNATEVILDVPPEKHIEKHYDLH